MDMFRRLLGQSGDNTERPKSTTGVTSIPASPPANVPPNPSGASAGSDTIPVADPSTTAVIDGATQRLPLETVIASRNAHLIFGQSTDVGMVRANNQDSLMTFYFSNRSVENRPDWGLFIVADGMGGHHDGEKASAMVTRKVSEQVMNRIFLPMIGNSLDEINQHPPLAESLIEAIQDANGSVLKDIPDAGTTITAVALVGDLAYFAHVGDSRAYLITRDGIEQITRDHSLVQRLIELDQITPEEAAEHPQHNVLYRAIGQSENLEVDAVTRRMPNNSYLLLCSDGLWGLVDNKTMAQIVRESANPQDACDKLVAKANMLGGKDNITAVLLYMPS